MSENKKNNKEGQDKEPKQRLSPYWIYALILMAILVIVGLPNFTSQKSELSEHDFFTELVPSKDIKSVVIVDRKFVKVFLKEEALKKETYTKVAKNKLDKPNPGPHYTVPIVTDYQTFSTKLDQAQASNNLTNVKTETSSNWGANLMYILPLFIILAIWLFIMRRVSGGMGGPGGQIFNIGKSKATLFDKDTQVNVTFNDVAGLDEAKEEVMEIVDFLKQPQKYTSLGGKIPKGALLIGPPGTGKTLLAKAMAGEAKVPFFSISGSDFVEMFVGVGASRVRDLFKQAREKAPCIIFIDEIDAIGRARGRNVMQGNDERENTLNQLLVEMDGFSSKKGIIMIAATNRPDVLDSALLRPGRFDRQIAIGRPDIKGREAIFKVHVKPLKAAKDLDILKIAAQTPGFVGADIANVCNEAALIAARKGKKEIDLKDFQDAIDRSIGGLERKNKIISPEEKEIIAYHEAGHAICGWYLEHADPLLKVTIVPRGIAALGYAQYVPKERYLYNGEELDDQICMLLGGRVAEDIIFGNVSTGAQNDLERITKMAYNMVTLYGLNDKVGNISFNDTKGEYNFQKPYSESTGEMIDDEVRKIIESAYQKTKVLLIERKSELVTIAKELLDKEILFKADLDRLIGRRPSEVLEEERAAGKRAKKTNIIEEIEIDDDLPTGKGDTPDDE